MPGEYTKGKNPSNNKEFLKKEMEEAKIELDSVKEMSKADESPKKKGNKVSWKPASRIGKLHVPEGYVGRWVKNDPDNIARYRQEGWELVNKTTHSKGGRSGHDGSDVKDQKNLNGAVEYRELIGMMLSQEMADARVEYHRQETIEKTRATILDNPESRGGKVTIN